MSRPNRDLNHLPISIDQANQRNRNAADQRGQASEFVETLLRFGIENLVRAQRPQSLGFIHRHGIRHRHNFKLIDKQRDRQSELRNPAKQIRSVAGPAEPTVCASSKKSKSLVERALESDLRSLPQCTFMKSAREKIVAASI